MIKDISIEAAKASPPVSAVAAHYVYGITLNDVSLFLVIAYTLLQAFFLIRDKWWRDKYVEPK